MKVEGTHLERVPSLVRNLEELECSERFDLADVRLIVAEDGSVQWSPNIPCCEELRATVRETIEAHNALDEAVRRR